MAAFIKKHLKTILMIAAAIAAVYVTVYLDVILRARHAYFEGEKYWSWHQNPDLKRKAIEEKYDAEIKKTENKMAKGSIEKKEYNMELQVLESGRKRELRESAIKYAYVWYQTAVELFSPPESKWVKLSREKMPRAKELWRRELLKKGIKVEDYMLE